MAQDIYQPIITSPFYDGATGDYEIYVTSDLWSSANGAANFQWYQWDGTPITNTSTPASANFKVGALNTTRVLAGNTNDLDIDFNNAVLYLKISAQGQLPNTDQTRTFYHENFFHPFPLSKAKLADPGITLSYANATKNFTVEATTGVAVWTWLDNPAGTLLNFDVNAFILLPGQPREIGYTLKSDSTGGNWVNEVTVQSLWNNTLAD